MPSERLPLTRARGYAAPAGGSMSRSVRFLVNAVVCLLVGAHAVYWFAMGRAEFASDTRIGLVVAQAVVGFAGAIWFFVRSRSAAS